MTYVLGFASFERLGDLISQNADRLRLLQTEKLSFSVTLRETPVTVVTDLLKTSEIFVKIRLLWLYTLVLVSETSETNIYIGHAAYYM